MSLVKQGEAETCDGGVRMLFCTDAEVEEMNNLVMIHREAVSEFAIPAHLAQFYTSWDQIYAEIKDGRTWHGVQPASSMFKRAQVAVLNFS